MKSKLQSAMEYLMTYGWAILIIAVVLGALFGLGFFNSANLAPKVGPGACQVYRPQGPETTSFVNLEGICNNELPQYIGQFGPTLKSFVNISNPNTFGSQAYTVAAWVRTNTIGFTTIVGRQNAGATQGYNFLIDNAGGFGIRIDTSSSGCTLYPSSPPANDLRWHFLVATVSLSSPVGVELYQDGALTSSQGSCGSTYNALTGGSLNIMGFGLGTGCCTSGMAADVQIYNSSLTSNEVTALYREGIGGVPILPQRLVGWWPLNGNANDYSGNLNNGVSYNVIYTSSWESGYTAP